MTVGTMPTETLLVKFSTVRAYKTVATGQASVINAFKTVLTKTHWNNTRIKATGTATFPFFVATVDGGTSLPKRAVGCGNTYISVGAANFVLYDSGREIPIVSDACIFVAMGTTQTSTLDNLVTAIDFSTQFNVTYASRAPSPGYIMNFEAKLGGPDTNYVVIGVDGRWGFGSNTDGGGYEFLTTEAFSPYSVRITS